MCYMNQEAFLLKRNNKVQSIAFLYDLLTWSKHVTKISDGDADTSIVSTALNLQNNGQSVMVVAYLYNEGKSTQNKIAEMSSIREGHNVLNPLTAGAAYIRVFIFY